MEALMNLSVSSVRCALQIALLGAITPNVRFISAKFLENHIDIYFFYDKQPSEEEKELSEVVSTEVMCSFQDIPTTNVHRIELAEPQMIPQEEGKISVYARFEKTPQEP